MARSFDISETQVLLHFAGDAFPCHGRILFERAGGSNWIGYSPDLDDGPQSVDLGYEAYELVQRNAPLPPACVAAGVYWFDPIDAGALRRMRRSAKVHAALLNADAGAVPGEHQWRYAEVDTDRFGETVDAAVVEGSEFVELAGHALANIDGVMYRAELVGEGELETWKKDKEKEEVDERLLPESEGQESLSDLLPALVANDKVWLMFAGPRATREFLEAVAGAQGNFVSYHSEWVRLSGVSSHSPAVYSHRHDLEFIRIAIHKDGLRATNLACLEQVVRHLLQTEKAVARNPASPDYGGLGVITDGTISAKGAAVTTGFDAWVADKQKEKAKALQQERLYRDEMARPGKSTSSGEERAPRPDRKAKAKAKT